LLLLLLQNFFKCGIQDTTVSAAYFDKPTQRSLLEEQLVKQSVEDLPLALARLMWEFFAQVGSSKTTERCQPSYPDVHTCVHVCWPALSSCPVSYQGKNTTVPGRPPFVEQQLQSRCLPRAATNTLLCPCRSM
jgi:hypothetical protein